MLQQLARFIKRISSIPVLVALILVSVLFPVLLFPAHGVGYIRLLDLYFSYSLDQVYEYLVRLGEGGRSAYTCMALTSDLVFPVIYSLAFSVALTLLLKKLLPGTSRFRYLCLIPFLIVIADWCENLNLAFVTRVFPEPADWVVRFASFFTSLKWVLVVLTLLMLVIALTIRVVSDIRGR